MSSAAVVIGALRNDVFFVEISVSKNVNPDRTSHLAGSELGLHCTHNTSTRVSGLKDLNH